MKRIGQDAACCASAAVAISRELGEGVVQFGDLGIAPARLRPALRAGTWGCWASLGLCISGKYGAAHLSLIA